jgi:hypothetical protein
VSVRSFWCPLLKRFVNVHKVTKLIIVLRLSLTIFTVNMFHQYVRHLTDCIRGEYRDRIMVRHAELRMYTIVMRRFEEFQHSVSVFVLLTIGFI